MNDVKCVKCGATRGEHKSNSGQLGARDSCPIYGDSREQWHPTNRFTPAESPAQTALNAVESSPEIRRLILKCIYAGVTAADLERLILASEHVKHLRARIAELEGQIKALTDPENDAEPCQLCQQYSAANAALREKLAAVERERDELAGRLFPIMGGPAIPWRLLTPHERQAQQNHGGQSLKRLAERGGLGPCEAVAILEDRKWHPMDRVMALARLKELVESDLRAENERLRALLKLFDDGQDCSLDHHGYCQTHGPMAIKDKPVCRVALARAALEGKGGVVK